MNEVTSNKLLPPIMINKNEDETKIETQMDMENSKMTISPSTNHRNENVPSIRSFNCNSLESDRTFEQTTRYRSIQAVINKSLNLLITINQSPNLTVGRTFKINPFGIVSDSENPNLLSRNKQDGYTYFGYIPNHENKLEIERQIDVEIQPDDKDDDTSLMKSQQQSNENKYGRYFQISFNPEYKQYYIKDCGLGFGTFVKIQNEFVMHNEKFVIFIGNTYVVAQIGGVDDNVSFTNDTSKLYSNINLTLRIFGNDSDNSENYPMNFQPSKSAIKIGRDNTCEVPINDTLVSRFHCSIEFRDNLGWVLRDGFSYKESDGTITSKYSTNGTWIFAAQDIAIHDGLIFKLKDHNFECKYVEG